MRPLKDVVILEDILIVQKIKVSKTVINKYYNISKLRHIFIYGLNLVPEIFFRKVCTIRTIFIINNILRFNIIYNILYT